VTDRATNRPGNGPQRPKRDPSEFLARFGNKNRTEINSAIRNHERAAIDEHLKERDKNAAARERTLSEAQTRSRARAATKDVRTGAFAPRGKSRSRNRMVLILATLATVLLVGVVIVPPLANGFFRSLAEANPDLMRIGLISDAVASVMDGRPDKPGGTDPSDVDFVIQPGESSSDITQDLVNRGIVTDRLAFTYVLVSENALDRLLSGTHILNRTMSPREVADALQGTPAVVGDQVPVALREGLRLEQIVAYLQTLPLTNFDAEQFYTLAVDPPASIKQKFPWLSVIPAGNSVEGFLGAGLFNVPANTDAEGMLDILLQRWQDSPAYGVMQQAQAQGKDFYQTLILGSIVEREAIHDSDKPLVAGVYQNRLNGLGGIRTLNSDPVLIYAKDTMNLRDLAVTQWPSYVFWTYDGIDAAASFEVTPDLDSFQVWQSRGLPDWPIDTPGVASLQAALNPDTSEGYLYFLGKNDGSGDLVFARTYEEHLHNIQIYLGGGSPEPSPASTVGVGVPNASSEAAP